MKKLYKTNLCAKASVQNVDAAEVDWPGIPDKSVGSEIEPFELDQDLMKVVSVLLSTGMNKNDDVFLAEEIVPARSTGAHKPVNVEHDRTKIVGHMLKTYLTAKDGTEIPEEEIEMLPSNFDVTNEAVLYKYLLPEIAEDVLEYANAGELFVSVEAWFTDYDYLVGDKIVRRNEKTSAVLDELLRANGGAGKYKGYKLGRVLRNILIGGVGLTGNPANPDSVIRSVASTLVCNTEDLDQDIVSCVVGSVLSEETMSKNKDNIAVEIKNLLAFVRSQYENRLSKAEVSEDAFTKTIAELEERIAVLTKERDELKQKVEAHAMNKLTKERKAILAKLFKSDSMITSELEKCLSMSEDEFNTYIGFLNAVRSDFLSENNEKPEGGDANIAKEEKKEEVVTEPVVEDEVKPEPVPEPTPEPEPEVTPVPEPEPESEQVVAPEPVIEQKEEVKTEEPKPKEPTPEPEPPKQETPVTQVVEPQEDKETGQDKEPRLEVPKKEIEPVLKQPVEKPEPEVEEEDVDIDSVEPVDIDLIPETDEVGDSVEDAFKNIVNKLKERWQKPTV